MSTYCFITFPTTYYAIRAEELLKNLDISFKMVPVPRRISSSCGTALRCTPGDLDRINEIFGGSEVEIEGIHHIDEEDPGLRGLLQRGPKK